MIASTAQLSEHGRAHGYAVAAVNILDDLSLRAAIAAAVEKSSPLIVQVSVKTVRSIGVELLTTMFRLAADTGYNEFDIAWQLSAERGWMVPAYTLPPNAQDVTIMRALVKETMSREHVDTLARDIEEACSTLAKKGGAHESERKKIVIGPGH